MHGFSKIENGFWNAKNFKEKSPSAIYHSKPIANKGFPCLPYLLNLQRLANREESEMADFFARYNPVQLLRKKLEVSGLPDETLGRKKNEALPNPIVESLLVHTTRPSQSVSKRFRLIQAVR